MGLDLSVYKVERKPDGKIDFNQINDISIPRYSANRDLISDEGIEREWIADEPFNPWYSDWMFWRPKDIPKAIEWAKSHYHEEAQELMVGIFDKMTKDPTIYIYNSF